MRSAKRSEYDFNRIISQQKIKYTKKFDELDLATCHQTIKSSLPHRLRVLRNLKVDCMTVSKLLRAKTYFCTGNTKLVFEFVLITFLNHAISGTKEIPELLTVLKHYLTLKLVDISHYVSI